MRIVVGRLLDSHIPMAVRVTGSDSAFLALCTPTSLGWRIAFVRESSVTTLLRTTMKSLPPFEYFSVMVDQEAYPRSSVPRQQRLAESVQPLDALGAHRVTLAVGLGNTDLLYRAYDRRRKLIELVVVFAAITALIGLVTLWQGHHRQARLSEMKSNFVASVSHELRAPLAAVRLMAESLENGRVVEAARRTDYYRLIAQECQRLSSLVENMLDLARVGRGRAYDLQPVDVPSLVRHSIALMEPCAAGCRVTLRLEEVGCAELRPTWDGQAVGQSLVNLLDNAIKHSPEGSEVEIRVESEPGKVRLWVEDHGQGIPQKEQKRIFDLFYRHGSELRRETKGVGIGLSIVRHVAEAHGGRVIVDSIVGRGSRFALELPVGKP